MTKAKRHWDRLGVELEGGWTKNPHEFLEYSSLVDFKTDGSVRVNAPFVGEVTVGPYDRLPRAATAMDHCYPEVVNETCGLHVHASMSVENAVRLACPAFFVHFEDFWTRWGKAHKVKGPFWDRLAGDNEFCEPNVPWDPGGYGNGSVPRLNRYSQVNFSAFQEHGTIECRLLPMFKRKRLGLKAVAAVLECYDTYLSDPDATGDRAPRIEPGYLGHPRDSTVDTQRRAREKLERYRRNKLTPEMAERHRRAPEIRAYSPFCEACNRYHEVVR